MPCSLPTQVHGRYGSFECFENGDRTFQIVENRHTLLPRLFFGAGLVPPAFEILRGPVHRNLTVST